MGTICYRLRLILRDTKYRLKCCDRLWVYFFAHLRNGTTQTGNLSGKSPLEEIGDFSNHLFKAKMDGSMADMVLLYKYISA